MLNVCCQKQLKSVVRGTSLPDRSPEGGAVKDYRCVPASEEDRKQLDVVLEEFNGIALKSDENEDFWLPNGPIPPGFLLPNGPFYFPILDSSPFLLDDWTHDVFNVMSH